jgi:hypothetical protein
MFRAHSTLRLILAAFVCAGFCGLNWAQVKNLSPQARGKQQIISEFTLEGGAVFALNHENNVNGQSQAGQSDPAPFVFGLSETFTTARPVFVVTGLVTESLAKAESALGFRMKNKDPPAA